jgi:glucose-1-phosphate cytidylyltransferase
MKVAILAGGLGSRLAEETEVKPKPMVEIGGRPILWHIMKQYAHYGYDQFTIALGYKGDYIKRYMLDYCSLAGDLTIQLDDGSCTRHRAVAEPWRVDLVETGLPTATGGRIKRLAPYLGGERFMLTWGDGVSDVDLDSLLEFHKAHGRLVTMTAVRPTARFGHLELEGDAVTEFSEKPQAREGWTVVF